MIVEECKEKISNYARYSIDSLENAMSIIECIEDLNDGQNEEINIIYKKLHAAINILKDI